jgi:hypothetical protein
MVLVRQKKQPRTNHVRGDKDSYFLSFMAAQKRDARDGACKSTAILPREQVRWERQYFVHASSMFTSAHEKAFCLLGGTVLCTWTCTALRC